MFTRLSDSERTFDLLDELRRQMDRVWSDFDDSHGVWRVASPRNLSSAAWPAVNVFDDGDKLVLHADIPGVAAKDVELTLHDGVLTLKGERKVEAPAGYAARRQERPAFRFTRSIALPVKVDPEKTIATAKDGVLTITLGKVAAARPRQIAVRTSA